MQLTMTISVAVIAGIMVAAVTFLIPVLLQIRRTAQQAEKMFETARMEMVPLGHDMTVISREAHGILQSIHRQVDHMEDGVTSVRDAAERLRDFEEDVIYRIEEPLRDISALFSAVARGLEVFFRVMRR
jgi:uncharacterized protein YoxC